MVDACYGAVQRLQRFSPCTGRPVSSRRPLNEAVGLSPFIVFCHAPRAGFFTDFGLPVLSLHLNGAIVASKSTLHRVWSMVKSWYVQRRSDPQTPPIPIFPLDAHLS